VVLGLLVACQLIPAAALIESSIINCADNNQHCHKALLLAIESSARSSKMLHGADEQKIQ